jgi:hypothetical protein
MSTASAVCIGSVLWALIQGSASAAPPAPPTPQSTYLGVDVSDGKGEVLYKLGKPDHVSNHPNGPGVVPTYDVNSSIVVFPVPKGQNFKSFDNWTYEFADADGEINASFYHNNDRLEYIYCRSPVVGKCPPAMGIGIGDQEALIVQRLGQPTKSRLDETFKTMTYGSLNVEFVLAKQRVIIIRVGRKLGQPFAARIF